MNRYHTFNQLYIETLDLISNNYEFENSPRGHSEREVLGFSCKLTNPLSRYCFHPMRKQNVIFNYAEALWYLSGKNDLDFISWYAPSMAKYSADGKTLPGTGYGKKLLHFGSDDLNQIARAVDIIKNDDVDSKRVFIQIFSADEDIYKTNIDVSCTLGLQLLLREGKLHMVAYMRANDAYVGMLGDIFSFTFIQEFIASMLGCEVGQYTHNVGSIHIYQSNQEKVQSILERPFETFEPICSPPVMPKSDFSVVSKVLEYEKKIRCSELSLNDINHLPLDEYWIEIIRLFKVNTYFQSGKSVPDMLIESVHPFHRSFLLNRLK
ncbi:thymidylate synthase [Xenorhabdus vietnamensis]|uniref:Thymidylate synthase n=1 Tax=Xenorhabdus vietnamensis TaxID=351656 RepID=A0A1Y2SFM5_9GAMM|nr:thymidylate synthase [Xenorhabdus vietnamensis]OTA17146.1 thymidylate synthase [Xenorhabdus vietnamensis]